MAIGCPGVPGRALFVPTPTLVAQLAKAHDESRIEDRLLHLSKPKLLIIDELGYLPFEPNAAHLFFQLVSRRCEGGIMLITSNRAVGKWARRSAIRSSHSAPFIAITKPQTASPVMLGDAERTAKPKSGPLLRIGKGIGWVGMRPRRAVNAGSVRVPRPPIPTAASFASPMSS